MAFKKLNPIKSGVNAFKLGGVDKATGKKLPSTIQGFYIGMQLVKSESSDTGFSKKYVFQTATGEQAIWGGHTNLDSALDLIEEGTNPMVIVTCLGKSKKGRWIDYDVQVDEDNQYVAGAAVEEVEDDTPSDDESDVGEEEILDEVPPARATAPKTPAKTPTAASQARTKDLLAKGRSARA